jgi:hypothetical protein
LLERNPWRQAVNYWWQSSPEKWVRKGAEIIRNRF